MHEPWKAFGMYRVIYQSQAKDGEYLKLSSEKKDKIFNILRGYLDLHLKNKAEEKKEQKEKKGNAFTREVFQDCFLDESGPLGRRRHISDESLSKVQQDAHLRSCLETNRGLTVRSLLLSRPLPTLILSR